MAKAEALGVEDVQEVLTDLYGLDGRAAKGEYRCFCPVHEAGEVGHSPSVDVNLETGYWNCFSCPASGDLVDLGVVVMKNVPYEERKKQKVWSRYRREIRQLLQPSDPTALAAAVHRRVTAHRRSVQARPVTKARSDVLIPPVDAYEFKYPKDLKVRGFTKETLERWNIRYAREATLLKDDGKSFTVDNAIAIPIFDRKEVLLGWCYRATERSANWFQQARYIYTPGLQDVLSTMWFGMHLHKNVSEITVVEGGLDAIWCDQNGIPALGILGSQVKQLVKIRMLMDFRKVTLMTDRDNAGSTTAYHLGIALQERGVPCSVVRYPAWMLNRKGERAKDPQDLSPLDLELAHIRAIPFITWRRGNRLAA